MSSDELHQRVVEYVNDHPVFKRVLDDEFLSELGERWSDPDHEFPEIYGLIVSGSDVDLDVLEKGLEFVLSTKQGGSKIEELKQSGDLNIGTCFEVASLGALVLEFGEKAVTPYPGLSSGRESDACLHVDGKSIYIEVAAWNLPEGFYKGTRGMRKEAKDVSCYWENDPRKRTEALIRKLQEKLPQSEPGMPNALVLSRYGRERTHAQAAVGDKAILECYFKAMGWGEPAKYFGGMFLLDRFTNPQWIPNENCDKESFVSTDVVAALQRALHRMAPAPIDRNCSGQPR